MADATSYDVQVASTSAFSPTLFAKTTTNRQIVPTSLLPEGTVYWRVRANGPSGSSSWSTTDINVAATQAPTPLSPADNGPALEQPANPPLLSWTAVQGAVSYQVEVDPDSDFIGAAKYVTKNPSLLVPDPAANGSYYWHVRAQLANGLYTAYSDANSNPWRFQIGSLAQVQTVAPTENQAAEDVFLEWQPVKGAKTYELQVSTDQDFNTIIDSKVNIKSTRYSPATTYLNDQYYWRVRARNNQNETIDWVSVDPKPAHTFQRNWPDKPSLVYPPNTMSPPVSDDFYFQWSPVDHATRYQLDVGTDPNFTPLTFNSCITASTTYTAGYTYPKADLCMPSQGSVTYWRVRALDDPANVQGIYSSISSFVYSAGEVQRVSPDNNSTVSVPTLSWQAMRDTEKYHVTVVNGANATVASFDTYSLSWTPTGATALDPAKGPYGWTVQAVDANGSLSPKYGNWTFNVTSPSGGGVRPDATDITAPSVRFPSLTWTPVANAAYYRIDIGISGSGFFFDNTYSPILNAQYPYAAATDIGKALLTPGTYDYQVEAFNSANASLGRGTQASFTIADLQATGGRQVALSGKRLDTSSACTYYLDAPTLPRVCENASTTPVLDWDPVPEAAYYMVYVGRDRELTNLVYGSIIPRTTSTRWTPSDVNNPSTFPDSQAGTAYYWFVRPCKASGVCAPDPVSTANAATNAFSKTSPQVKLLSPADKATVSNDVTFTWQDYLTSSLTSTWGPTSESGNQAAKQYRIQVSTTDSFATLLDNQVVDQATYTAWDRTYPEGTLYWRVQAIDAENNGLQWSPTWQVTKSSPAAALATPKGAAGPITSACPTPTITASCTSGTSPFVWAPSDFAGGYQLEVYKNDDTNWSPTNRVISVTTKQTAYVHSVPLPANTSAYVWRVARLDADNRPGQWSATGRFFSLGVSPTLTAPAVNGVVNGYAPYMTWIGAPGAVSYRFERRPAGGSTLAESVTTNAQAYAPTSIIPTGTWEWRVVAINVSGAELGSSEWRRFTVDNNRGSFTPVTPQRFLDTRTGLGAPKAKVGAGRTITVTVPGLPAGVSSVVLNVTATNTTATGYVRVWPYGQPLPSTSSLNFTAKKTVPNLVMVRVGPGGRISLNNSAGTTDLIADLSGYFAPDLGSGFTAVPPQRVLDTRSGVGHLGAVGAGQAITLTVPNIPAGTKAVVLNVTVTRPTASSHLIVYPYGTTRPNVSNLNFVAGQTVPNLVTAPVDGAGRVSIYNYAGSTHVVADLAGYYRVGSGSTYAGVTPVRVMDTRTGVGVTKGKIPAGGSKTLTVPGLPAGTTAVALNVTVTGPTNGSVLTVYPADAARPTASNLNYVAGQTIANMVVVKVGAGNKITFFNSYGSVDVIADLAGSFAR
ncbi:hypothetical protein [Terrabacter sp. C0L_2]|uniref:hypothetical protein n=1 Tax=Terrabacter sp. C0L_2 TaxID=3108389 RepID=UPI002ED42234|nr:hypothetical protein U5C87_08085 [Terrabacter sp. C0L_2]